MLLLTYIARVTDGLLLAASMQDERQFPESEIYKQQAKRIFRQLTSAPTRLSLESGNYVFHYIIEADVCYLTLCERGYPRRLAFGYLEELQREFHSRYALEVATADRPYSFVRFDPVIDRLKQQYQDIHSKRNLERLNDELQDVQRVMVRNIEEVFGRGQRLDAVSQISQQVRAQSATFAKSAHDLNMLAMWRQYGPWIIVAVIVIFALLLRFMLFG